MNSVEMYPKTIVDLLLNYDANLAIPDCISAKQQEDLRQLVKYTRLVDGFYIKPISYKKKLYGNIPYGRLYGDKPSIQNISSFVRRALFDKTKVGVDIVNSNPTLLHQLVLKHAQHSYPSLQTYVDDREGILDNTMKHFDVNRKQAKTLFLRLVFGGTVKNWAIDENINESIEFDFVTRFQNEIHQIYRMEFERFPGYKVAYDCFEQIEKEGRVKERTALSLYLQNIEGDIQLQFVQACKSIGIKAGIPLHDEQIFDKMDDNRIQSVMCHLKSHILNTMGFDIELKEQTYNLTADDLAILNAHSTKPIVHDQDYETLKTDFEKTAFKITDTCELAFINAVGELIVCDKRRFTIRFEELHYIDERGMEKQFITKWYLDPNKRSYRKVDYIFPPMVCPDDVYNFWNGFEIEKYSGETKPCDAILNLIEILCNREDETYNYVLDWLANIVQEPGLKPGTAILFKSSQGAGKGTLVTIMRKILGDKLGETSHPQNDVFGSHGNVHIGKLLTSMDEIRMKDTRGDLGRLKNLITSSHVIYNEKNVRQREVANNTRFMFSTNETIPISIDADDRRYCIVKSSDELCKNPDYWNDLYKNHVNNDAVIRGFFDYLKERDITQRVWTQLPQTEMRNDLLELSIHPMLVWFDLFVHRTREDEVFVSTHALFQDYKSHCLLNNINAPTTSRGFHFIFRDLVLVKAPGVERGRTPTLRGFHINRKKVFEWLYESKYSQFESLDFSDEDESMFTF
jgi:energy-coupling factor transporter ATP-binding protein EcfA2